MKPAIKSFGGKSGMIHELTSHFPEWASYDIFIDAFGGSGAVTLSQPLGKIEIYNDIDKNIYSVYKAISDPTLFEEFKQKCDLSLYMEDLRKEFKQKIKDPSISLVERAFMFWYINRVSHNGIGGFSTTGCIRRNMSKSTSDFLSSIDRLKEMHDRFSSIIVENRDAIKLMEKYNQDNVFVYSDPPYHHDTRGSTRYACDYTDEQHEQFIDCVLKLKSKVLISGYECDQYKRLEPKFKRVDFQVKTIDGNFNPKTKTESLWKNY